MNSRLMHVFHNTPFGREAFLQSIYFCEKTGLGLKVYIPEHSQFAMSFQGESVTVDLDKSFLGSAETARRHARELLGPAGVEASFLEPEGDTGSSFPDIPADFSLMSCPRPVSDLSTKTGSGHHIGRKVRALINGAPFPVLIPTPVYKQWKHILVFFGGSANALSAVQLGMKLQLMSGQPLKLFTYAEKKPRSCYEEILEEHHLLSEIKSGHVEWIYAEKGPLREALYNVSHEALIVAGASRHGFVKDLMFGNIMEEMQTTLPNNMVVVGPHYSDN